MKSERQVLTAMLSRALDSVQLLEKQVEDAAPEIRRRWHQRVVGIREKVEIAVQTLSGEAG